MIKGITFRDPILSVIRYPDGKTNLEGLFPETEPLSWRIIIDNINITNARMNFVDGPGQRNIELNNVTARIIPDLIKKEFMGTLSAEGHYKDQKISRPGLKIKGTATLKIGKDMMKTVSLKDVSISSPAGSGLRASGLINGDGSLDLGGNMILVMEDLREFVPEKKDIQGKIRFAGRITGSNISPMAEGSIVAEDFSYDKVKFGSMRGDLSYENGIINLSNLKSDILNGRMEGNIVLDYKEKVPSYRAALSGDGLQPYPVIKHYRPDMLSHIHEESYVSGHIETWGPISGLSYRQPEAFGLGVEAKGWLSYKDKEKKIALSGELKNGLEINAGISGELKDIAGYVNIPRFPLHGSASVNGEISGTFNKPVISGIVMMSKGAVKGIEFDSITADLKFTEDTLYLQPVTFRRSKAVYSISGNIRFNSARQTGTLFDLEGQIIQGNPGEVAQIFFQKLPLDVKTDGRLTFKGTGDDFNGTAELSISEGTAYGQRLDRGDVAITLTSDKVIFGKVRAERKGEALIGNGWIGFRGESQGKFQADILSDQLSLENIDIISGKYPFISGKGSIKFTAGGMISNPRIDAAIEMPQLQINEKDTGPARFLATRDQGDIMINGEVLYLQYEGHAGWDREAPFALSVRNEDENTIQPLLLLLKPSMVQDISLNAAGEAFIEGRLADLRTLRMKIALAKLKVIYSDYQVENEGDVNLSYENMKLTLDSVRLRGEGTSLNAIGNIVIHGDVNIFINGEADLRLLSLITPEIKYSKGTAFAAFLISGEMENPSIRGGLAIKDGTLRSATLKQTLENANISIFFNGREIVLESMNGMIGGGSVNGSGKVTIEDFVVKDFGFALEVANAVFRYPEGFESRLDGTLILQGTPETKSLKGEVRIRKASYEKKLNISTLVLELQRKKARLEQPVPFIGDTELNIHISGKKEIWINNNLAKLPFEVDLILRGTIDHPLLFGRVEAKDGTFVFNRNQFNVVSATADFVSPDMIRPVMDIHATTNVGEYSIDLRLTGTTDRFNLSLSSDPSLSETDILALLTVGQTAGETADIMKEVGAVEATVFLAAPIQEKIEGTMQDIIKIDRFQVEPYYSSSTASEGARLTVGKRLLNDRLYVTYTTGITSIEELIKLEYFLGKNVFIVGERDELGRISGDIKFRFEFR